MRTTLAIENLWPALAVANDGCLVTLDHRVAATTVEGAGAANLLHL